MKERPILFSAPMVRAILNGSKRQTRRVVKRHNMDHPAIKEYILRLCPYGQPGDQLWVRENFCKPPNDDYKYRADDGFDGWKWKPSIHMPRVASRINLRIDDIRVERLQDITEHDAMREGIIQINISSLTKGASIPTTHAYPNHNGAGFCQDAVHSFETLWQRINGEKSWDENPWVWVIEFQRIKPE